MLDPRHTPVTDNTNDDNTNDDDANDTGPPEGAGDARKRRKPSQADRKSTRLNSSHPSLSRMPSSA